MPPSAQHGDDGRFDFINTATKPSAGGFQQLGACIVKIVHQKRRDRVAFLLELLLPLIFVVGTVFIWLAFGNSTNGAAQFINYASPGTLAAPQTSMTALRATLCYSDAANPIPGLQQCTAFGSFTCFQPPIALPVTGFCHDSTISRSYYVGVLGFIMSQASHSLAAPIDLNDIILLKWLAVCTMYTRLKGSSYYTNMAAILNTGYLYFTPNSAAVTSLVSHLNSTVPLFPLVYGGTFAPGAAEAYVKSSVSETKNWGIIQVDALTASQFSVQVRLNHTGMPDTSLKLDKYYLGGATDSNGLYLLNGFYSLQTAILNYYMNTVVGASPAIPKPYVAPMGFAAYDTQDFLAFGGQLAPLIIVLGFLYPVSQLSKRLVLEKELRIREAMMIMGLGNAPFYFAWVIVYTAMYLFTSIIMTIILKNTYVTKVNNGVLFFTFFFFQLSTISLSGLISAFFSKSRLAALITPLVYTVLAIPLFAISNASAAVNRFLLILSPTAFAEAINLIFQRELGGGLGSSDLKSDDPSMIAILILLAIDTIAYFLLWLYVDAVMPNDWGTTRHPLFCIVEPVRWLFCKVCCRRGRSDEELPDGRNPNGVFEELPAGVIRTTVDIRGLRKEFDRGGKTFTAVNNLYWSLEEGQISVLLGHNGAGKSTTLNMMTGMLEADGGDCFIYGHSVRHELHKVRQEIGYCPQHNILWPELTCEEHLNFFASIKGLKGVEREKAVTDTLQAVDLLEKRHYIASALSGGQKRKLSVANAFVGGSRLIFLDEPTAGMDVAARRHTWDLLRKMAETHTILLTTHFMDEADLLGHKVAIMSNGSLQCSGSSLYLKSRLGVGYNIVLSVEAHVDGNRIEQAIRRFIPAAELVSSGVGEICYKLPSAAMHAFQPLMSELEDHGKSLGVRNFSVSATTLEEIFLEIAHGEDSEKKPLLQNAAKQGAAVPPPPPHPAQGATDLRLTHTPMSDSNAPVHVRIPPHPSSCVWNIPRLETDSTALFTSQMKCMLVKRFRNSSRDRRTQCLQVVCPVVCILLAMLLTLIDFFNAPSFQLTSDFYGDSLEMDTYNCASLMDLSIPFSSLTTTVVPTGVASALDLSNKLMTESKARNSDIRRYGAMACQDAQMKTALSSSTDVSISLYNSSAPHEMIIGVFNYYNAIFRKSAGSTAFLTMWNNPMPKTDREDAVSSSIKSILIGIIIMIPFTFIPSTFVSWIVKERECKARHLQNVSGLKFSVYWISNFLFDIASFIITMCLALVVFAIFNRTEYIGKDAIGACIVLFVFYGLSGIAFSYLVSFVFSEHSTAQNIVMLGNFIAGFLLVLLVFILSIVDSTKDASKVLAFIFRVIPSYALGDGIINLALLQLRSAFSTTDTAFSMTVVGYDILYMAIEFPVALLLTLFIDHPARRMRTQMLLHNPNAAVELQQNEDEDVKRERNEVEEPEKYGRQNDLVRVRNLRKEYGNGKVAVKNLSFGVRPGEVFGFLGTNGAGKTTTISVLCQEIYPTSGHGYIAGLDIVQDSARALQCIGYCPQFDALLDLLTVEEHLYLYAGVRGIIGDNRDRVVENLASLCELTQYLPTVASELSGGNKRKLSVALSLIGGPSVVFLDEPSAGMDPVARRGLWTAISTVADNCAVVLTTHHLEEVEALAHRVAIMVNGSLHCIGDKLHLKTKFGSGFEMSVRIKNDDLVKPFEDFMKAHMPAATVNECRSLRFSYALPQNTKLSQAFGLIESHKEALGITDYSIAQTSIEQVFLRISLEAEAAEQD